MAQHERKWWLWIAIALLGANMIVRLVDQAKILHYFPVDPYFYDGGSYLAQLHFMQVCGFHTFCPYWYNGFIAFKFSPPGWYFFTLPWYTLVHDVRIIAFVSIIGMLGLGLLIILFLGKETLGSRLRRVFFFLLFFGNAIAIGNFIRLGRFHELFAWLGVLAIFFIILHYQKRPLDKRFALLIPFLTIVIVSYQSLGVFALLLIGGLWLAKGRKDRAWITVCVLTACILITFWTYPFLRDIAQSSITSYKQSSVLLQPHGGNMLTFITTFLFPLILLGLFCTYVWQRRLRIRETILFVPVLVIALLFLTRLIIFIPILNDIRPDPYLLFFSLFVGYFFLHIDLARTTRWLRWLLITGLLLGSVASVSANIFHTQWFWTPNQPLNQDIERILPTLNERYMFVGDFPDYAISTMYYAYASIYWNASSAGGVYPHEKDSSYVHAKLSAVNDAVKAKDCPALRSALTDVQTRLVLSWGETCTFLALCQPRETITSGTVCRVIL